MQKSMVMFSDFLWIIAISNPCSRADLPSVHTFIFLNFFKKQSRLPSFHSSLRVRGGLAVNTSDSGTRGRCSSPTLVFLSHSLDTELINFDHHLSCGGLLNFEFS